MQQIADMNTGTRYQLTALRQRQLCKNFR